MALDFREATDVQSGTNGSEEQQVHNHVNTSSQFTPPLKTKKKKPFIMVKTGMAPLSNGVEKKGDDYEESYVKTLLNDQSLVESDILLNRPSIANANADIMSSSGNSVVITPTTQTNHTLSSMKLLLSDSNDGENSAHNVNSNDMNYSDSDFESNLIGRLDNKQEDNVSNSFTSTSSSDYNSDEIIRLDTSSDSDVSSSDTSSDEDIDIMPENPATLDRSLHYAIQKFQGPESSHCPLQKNEECVVLNDEDVYWWLVRRVKDGRIGFVPGELLEGWTEKLAKWNTYINERQACIQEDEEEEPFEANNVDFNNSNNAVSKVSNGTENSEDNPPVQNSSNFGANVKFDENVTYVPYDSLESVYSGSLHEDLNLDDDYKSDVSWGSMPKLQIKKNKGGDNSEKKIGLHQNISSDEEDSTIWKPEKPFVNTEHTSSPSIGEYSTSQDSFQTSGADTTSSASEDDDLHSAVSKEYNPVIEKMDEIIKRLR